MPVLRIYAKYLMIVTSEGEELGRLDIKNKFKDSTYEEKGFNIADLLITMKKPGVAVGCMFITDNGKVYGFQPFVGGPVSVKAGEQLCYAVGAMKFKQKSDDDGVRIIA